MALAVHSTKKLRSRTAPPQVILSAGNIAHYHHTAFALQEAGYLKQYYCVFSGLDDFGNFQSVLPPTWQKRLHSKHLPGLNRRYVTSIPWPYLGARMLQQMGLLSQEQASVRFGAWFDTATRKRTQAGSVFHFVNGIGLETASQLGDQGFLTICDVRAAYIDSEDALFNEEYKRLGLQYKSLRWALRPRLLAEYAVADAIIVPSAYVAETFCQNGIPSDKLHVLPFGVDLARFQMGVTSKHGKKDGQRFQALFVGRINPGKGVHYLIEAFGRLKLPKSQLLIVGRVDDAAYGRYLETLVEQYKVNVTFLGHLPQTDLWHIYQQSDLFVLPTLSEGSAMVVYEAMAAGLPILTTNHAGSVVADGEEGFIVPIRNSEAMEEKMHLLFKRTDLRQAMGKQSRLRVQDFSWEKYGQRLLSVYGKIWASRGTKQR